MNPTDAYLLTLINLTDSMKQEVGPEDGYGVTLWVGGQMMTGFMVPNWQMPRLFGKPGPDDDSVFAPLEEWVREKNGEHEALRSKDEADLTAEDHERADQLTPAFINLQNVKMMGPDAIMMPTGPSSLALRVRLDAVDAWTLGIVAISRD